MTNLNVDKFLSSLTAGQAMTKAPDLMRREIIVNTKTGRPRQAGADSEDGAFIKTFRRMCEKDLYIFCKAVLGFDRLVEHFHKPICRHAQKIPPFRKMFLLPRDHFKTTLFSKGLPMHMFIQPRDTNCYFPKMNGIETKILLACEKEDRATKHIQFIEAHFEKNKLLRSLWADKMWEKPQRDARRWSSTEFILPREISFEQSDVSMQGIGIGGAITGGHFHVLLKDDLVSFEAMNSPTVMQTAIDWHRISRPLMEDVDTSLEFIIGTRWAVVDLYSDIMDNDPSVDVYKRSVMEDGKIIFPEEFTLKGLKGLEDQLKGLYALQFMNDPRSSMLTDFREEQLRYFTENRDQIIFDDDIRDEHNFEILNAPVDEPEAPAWKTFEPYTGNDPIERERQNYFRAKST